MTVHHATFAIERTYDAAPSRVFAAFATAEAKARWSACHGEWEQLESVFDFRVGGLEVSEVAPRGGPVQRVEIRYQDITPNERIVFVYDMATDGVKTSASLVTVTFEPADAGTRLVFNEQGVFLAGQDGEMIREGTRIGLERLAEALAETSANV